MWPSDSGEECDELSWDRLAAVTAAAAAFFAAQLASAQLTSAHPGSAHHASAGWAPGYLVARGFRPRTWRRWGIGYAPGDWTALTGYLRGLGIPDNAIVAAGLARPTARGTLIDVFRDRVVFPVRTSDGIVAGFIGRAPPASSGPPVYLNTGATPLYHKGELLFGLYEARAALEAGAIPVLVEGPFDAIAVTACGGGRLAGLAPCGTALTTAQVTLLGDVADLASTGLLVAFDGDRPGQLAAIRAFPLLTSAAGWVSTVTLPDGQDPAGYFREQGPDRLAEFLTSQRHPLADLVIDARIDEFTRWLRYPEGTYNALHAAAAAIARLPPHYVARQVIRTARRLGLRHEEVTEALIAELR